MIDEKKLIEEIEKRLLVGTSVIKLIKEQPQVQGTELLEKALYGACRENAILDSDGICCSRYVDDENCNSEKEITFSKQLEACTKCKMNYFLEIAKCRIDEESEVTENETN